MDGQEMTTITGSFSVPYVFAVVGVLCLLAYVLFRPGGRKVRLPRAPSQHPQSRSKPTPSRVFHGTSRQAAMDIVKKKRTGREKCDHRGVSAGARGIGASGGTGGTFADTYRLDQKGDGAGA